MLFCVECNTIFFITNDYISLRLKRWIFDKCPLCYYLLCPLMTADTGACVDSTSLCKTWRHMLRTQGSTNFLVMTRRPAFLTLHAPSEMFGGAEVRWLWKGKTLTVRTPLSLLFFSLQSSEVRLGSICCFSMNPSPQRYEPQGVAYLWGVEWYSSSPGSEWSQFLCRCQCATILFNCGF